MGIVFVENKTLHKELYNAKLLILKTPVPTPSINKIKITILKHNPLNMNSKLAIIA